MQHMLPGPVV